ncbi:hypothetical protein [Trichothermofontia sp.]
MEIGNSKISQTLCAYSLSLAKKYGDDQFFALEWARVQETVIINHARWLDFHGGVRPQKTRLSALCIMDLIYSHIRIIGQLLPSRSSNMNENLLPNIGSTGRLRLRLAAGEPNR